MSSLRNKLVEVGFSTGWGVVRTLPRKLVWPVFAAGADASVRRDGPGVRRLAGNLRRVVGPDLPDGRHVLYVTSDNDLSSTMPTWFYAFAITADALPKFQRQVIHN